MITKTLKKQLMNLLNGLFFFSGSAQKDSFSVIRMSGENA